MIFVYLLINTLSETERFITLYDLKFAIEL